MSIKGTCDLKAGNGSDAASRHFREWMVLSGDLSTVPEFQEVLGHFLSVSTERKGHMGLNERKSEQ